MIRISVDTSAVAQLGDKIARKAQRCTAIALTKTAQHAQREVVSDLGRVLDRPTPFTQRATVVKAAKYDRPNRMVASVQWKDWQAKYMQHMVAGNPAQRAPKRFELALQAAGVMPRGWYAVPARGLGLDGYGNVGRGFIMKIISQIGSELLDGYYNRSRDAKKLAVNKRRNGSFFVKLPGNREGLPPGIYQRIGGGLGQKTRMVLAYVQHAGYRPRFDLDQRGQQAVDRHFATEFQKAFAT
ncbi:hypothetical protein [Chitinilyticum aquatile]|uniref:hypothetical protein n=1 Tax=Chitinilyticum aquatile TaxID=362520 RepID=UPI0003F98671|nr:hypothetical protein [Chitinilyticum aquatile]